MDELYLKSLEAHAAHVKSHSQGLIKNELPYTSSIVAPQTIWTSTEKGIFFHALARFSRLRPDLIAETIGTKSPAEVSAYIAALADASYQESIGMSSKARGKLPAARELSSRWISLEEEMSRSILLGQAAAERDAISEPRRVACIEVGLTPRNTHYNAALRVHRKMKRKRGSTDPIPDGESSKRRALELAWIREDLFRDLDRHRLVVLDDIIDEAEGPQLSADHLAGTSAPSRHSGTERVTPADEGEEILSSSQLASLSSEERTRYRKRMHMRRKRAKQEAILRGQNPESVPVNMSVCRLKKGRRSRRNVPERDKDVLPNSNHTAPDPKPVLVPNNEAPSLERSKTAKNIRSLMDYVSYGLDDMRKDGLDLFYFSRLGNLSRMYARSHVDFDDPAFLSISSVNHPDSEFTTPHSTILYSTLQLIRAYIKHRLTKQIQLSISIANEERISKSRTKAWKKKETSVNISHVKRAIQLSGQSLPSRKIFFRQLSSRLSLQVEDAGDGGDVDDPTDDDMEREDSATDPANYSFWRNTPHTTPSNGASLHPRAERTGYEDDDDTFVRRTLWEDELELISLKDDTEELRIELRQEKDLEDKDEEEDREYEELLLGMFTSDSLLDDDVAVEGPETDAEFDVVEEAPDVETGAEDTENNEESVEEAVAAKLGHSENTFKSREFLRSSDDEDADMYE